MDKAALGATALSNSDYSTAIKEYTAAIKQNPAAVKYYIQRSTAYQRSQQYIEALADAEYAVLLAHKRASRDLIKEAQLRRGISLFFVERYADAEFVLNIVKRLDEKEKSLGIWTMKVSKKLKELEEGDDRAKLMAKEIPDVEAPNSGLEKKEEVKDEKKPGGVAAEASQAAQSSSTPVVPTQANKIKHDWYQSNDTVSFTLMAKGVDKEKAVVDITKDALSITFPITDPSTGSTSDFSFDIEPLYLEVNPDTSTFQIKATKIDVTLKKAQPGIKWHALEGTRDTSASSDEKPTIPRHILSTTDAPPAYPTSSRKGAKDWDKVAEDLSKKKVKTEDGEDDEGGIDDEGDETSAFFKKLYSGATPEQQRAMMKSYSESGGTVLSTDWSQVAKKTVVPEPPEGMEAKKY
ncbi:SGS domain-containing protein [Dendryphion nanum]|uniref:SGS domain-containing protein n=1 Tax=Dendryphion nanum TaxID=256645 RepID=A0A9P9IYH7_9PLEO|nr:SGS domain-containing protein [Dendryphion nanum]